PTVFIPYVAELSSKGGNGAGLRSHLHRPTQVAAETVRSRLGLPVPTSALIARCVLESLERIVPIDVTTYAGRHFARHRGQTRDMLAGWAAAQSSPALHAQIAELARARLGAAVDRAGPRRTHAAAVRSRMVTRRPTT